MSDNRYLEEIIRLEKEREELLRMLSQDERDEYEKFKKRFSETDHRRQEEEEKEKEK